MPRMIGAVALGMGLSGILMNIIRLIIISIGSKDDENPFANTLAFYLVNSTFNLTAAGMYFVEQRNPLAKWVNTKVINQNKNKPPVDLSKKLASMYQSAKLVYKTLGYLILVYVVTFSVFPGVTTFTNFTFLKRDSPW